MIYPKYEDLLNMKERIGQSGIKSRNRSVARMHGGQASLSKGRGLDFSEFREYSAEDDIRSIDWRVTARTGRPHTKIFREERERNIFIFIDLGARMRFGTRKTFKSVQAARAAALIAWMANRSRDKIGAVVFGQVEGGVKILRPRNSRLPLWQLFKILCVPPEFGQTTVPIVAAMRSARQTMPSGSSVFVISDFAESDSDFERALCAIGQKRDVTLIQITDPADSRIADLGEIQFVDADGHAAKIDTHNRNGGATYTKLWEQNQKNLEQAAAKARAKLIRISTDGDVTNALAKEFRSRK